VALSNSLIVAEQWGLAFCGGLEVENESMSQYPMRRVWPYCLFAGDPLPILQVGSEKCSPRERDRDSAEAGPLSSFCGLTPIHALTSQYPHPRGLRALG